MPQNIFKIFDGRTNFWQWDTKQKLIVLDERVDEVHFSNRDLTHSIKSEVYEEGGLRICHVPSDLLKLPRNLVAYAYADGTTIKSVKFAVMKRPMPSDYISNRDKEIEERFTQIDTMLETINENKADDIYYNEDENYIQLVANGEPIGNRVEITNSAECGIENFEINEEGHLIATLTNGKVIDAGYVGSANGATFTPHISEDLILSWTCDQDRPVPEPVDLSPFNDWIELGDDGEADTQYTWEFM
jgi:hypothetical protein